MCGIVGWISNTPKSWAGDKKDFLSAGLIIDTIRGMDSTGVFAVSDDKRKRKPGWVKKVAPGPSLVMDEKYRELFDKGGAGRWRAMIGHNRKATKGKIGVDTAHPFQEGPITLVHNGTLDNTLDIPYKMHESHNDSHAIARSLVDMDKVELIGALSGAFALVWHDSRDHTINIVRNMQRPLHLAKSRSGETIYIASEAEQLYWLGKKLNLQLGKIVQPVAGRLLTFTPGSIIPEVTNCPLDVRPNQAPASIGFSTGGTRKITSTSREPAAAQPEKDAKPPKVLIGKERRPIPDVLLLQLMELDLDPSMMLEFVPKSAELIVGDTETFLVRGYIHMPSSLALDMMPATIHGVLPRIWKEHGNHSWTVRPVGVTYIGRLQRSLVVKIQAYLSGYGGYLRSVESIERLRQAPNMGMTAKEIVDASEKKSMLALPPPKIDPIEKEHTLDRTDPDFFTDHVKGKYGALVSAAQFDRDTREGCSFCSGNISIVDAERLTWVNNGATPLCVDCSEGAFGTEEPDVKDWYLPCVVCADYTLQSAMKSRMCIPCQLDHTQHISRMEKTGE